MSRDLVIVSGAPRSGTSLMMMVLEAGGYETIVEDGPRGRVDAPGHPGGRYESKDMHAIVMDKSLPATWAGKSIKLLTNHLPHVPRGVPAKILWMERDMAAQLASWTELHPQTAKTGDIIRRKTQVFAMLQRRPEWSVLVVQFDDLVANPVAECQRIADFVGGDLDVAKMAKVPKASHRHWKAGGQRV